ncbi:iron-siderophore ABC transporter substrate-binding protein [Streptomyces sp. NPDC050085]|uniref:iron-siderophore ABC transporter substrate-binding protein n=1 Tax=Streptomyces sp. NPDC050085 TaxID=3365600 RepID=UPI0037BC00F1
MSHVSRRTFLLGALGASGAVAGLAACSSGSGSVGSSGSSGSDSTTAAAPAPSAPADGMGSAQGDGVFPRTVKHYGGTTKVAARPVRVVVLGTGQLDDALVLGHAPAGATYGIGEDLIPGYLVEAFPQQAAALKKTARLGERTAPNLEAIEAAKPDLILGNSSQQDLYKKLSAIAPTVLTKGQGINWKADFLLMASALGAQGDAEKALAAYAKSADGVGRAAVTVSLVAFSTGRTRMWGTRSFSGSVLTDLGYGRPDAQRFADTSKDLSAEQLAEVDADWIFYGVQEGADVEDVVNGDLWKSLSAVRAGRAVKVAYTPWFLSAGQTAADRVVADLAKHLTK